jgi:mRNA-degrading endonuclease RelE of RelBE toxin-antitoxin system
MFKIVYGEDVLHFLKEVPAAKRTAILDTIEEQLLVEPMRETRNRKILEGVTPPWEHEAALWELRIREFRVFYDVQEEEQCVVIRAIRRKPPHKTTEEIL